MSQEFCKAGCGKALPARVRIKGRFRGPKKEYCSGACRLRAWKSKKVVVDKADLARVLKDLESRG